jgi:hypothetical protein
LCSFPIRCPRESFLTTALPTCRGEVRVTTVGQGAVNTVSPNRCVGRCRSDWATTTALVLKTYGQLMPEHGRQNTPRHRRRVDH